MPPPLKPEARTWTEEDYDFVAACWNDARTCLQYNFYIGHKLHVVRRLNLVMEAVIAATASGSAIASWTFWSSNAGVYLWSGLAGIAAVIATVKPFMNFGGLIEVYSKIVGEYRAIASSLEGTVFNIQQRRSIADEDRRRYNDLRERMQKAGSHLPEKFDEALLRECEQRVLQEKPATTLWAPKVMGKHPRLKQAALDDPPVEDAFSPQKRPPEGGLSIPVATDR